ncbi:hypothetical protein [Corynebacterium accolens]|nr:hypothetical protein [Corynebacterium accolens]MDK8592941.1 hypothetical protein [Corynebacterium accolens]
MTGCYPPNDGGTHPVMMYVHGGQAVLNALADAAGLDRAFCLVYATI